MDIWKILNIQPTDDKKQIKISYAKLVAKYHPEEFPEEFKQIHDAYTIAIKNIDDEKIKQKFNNNNINSDIKLYKFPELNRKDLDLEKKFINPNIKKVNKQSKIINYEFQDFGYNDLENIDKLEDINNLENINKLKNINNLTSINNLKDYKENKENKNILRRLKKIKKIKILKVYLIYVLLITFILYKYVLFLND